MTRIPMSLEVRCLRIPTKWSIRKENISGVWMLVPEVSQGFELMLTRLDDPWGIRNEFFRMPHDEESACSFLTRVGVWNAVEDKRATGAVGGMLLSGAFGHRLFFGRALPMTLEELWKEQEHWKTLLLDKKLLRNEFRLAPPQNSAPWQKVEFAAKAHLQNTLTIHIEWDRRDTPSGVLQPITGRQLIIATLHVDMLRDADVQVCQRNDCGIPFTGTKRKYCWWNCGHLVSSRNQRNKKRKEQREGNHAKKR